MKYELLLLLTLFFANCAALFEGDDCVMVDPGLGGGKCTELDKCNYAKQLLRTRKSRPQTCGFKKRSSLVCCPISGKLSANIPISEEKCREYHHPRFSRTNVAGGTQAIRNEFPHMSALGYGKKKSDVKWLCGGSLITEKFILTAAHCMANTEFGQPKWVRLGDLNLNALDDGDPQDIEILEVFVHPDYKSQSHYHDIALVKLRASAKLGRDVRPACIHTKKELPSSRVQVIGWGSTGFLEDGSDHLMQATLNVIGHTECAKIYATASGRRLANGIREESQICAGDSSGKDTCPGDSGGPLQFLETGSANSLNYFVIAGVTSFGKGCGIGNTAGVYTRVSSYRSWIESIVWPR